MDGNILIIILIVVLIFGVIFVALLNYGAGKRRDWERDDRLQEEAIKKMNEKKEKK